MLGNLNLALKVNGLVATMVSNLGSYMVANSVNLKALLKGNYWEWLTVEQLDFYSVARKENCVVDLTVVR
jgi:hypothetical protein